MGFFVKQELEVLVGSAGWGEKVGPTPRPGAEAPVQTLREGETEKDTENTQRYKNKVDGRGQAEEMHGETKKKKARHLRGRKTERRLRRNQTWAFGEKMPKKFSEFT